MNDEKQRNDYEVFFLSFSFLFSCSNESILTKNWINGTMAYYITRPNMLY